MTDLVLSLHGMALEYHSIMKGKSKKNNCQTTWVSEEHFKPVKLSSKTVKGVKIDDVVQDERQKYKHLTRSLVG